MRCRVGDLAYHCGGYIVDVVQLAPFPGEWVVKYQSFMTFADGTYEYGCAPDSWLTPIRGDLPEVEEMHDLIPSASSEPTESQALGAHQ